MAKVVVKCANPACPARYAVEESALGKRATCKKCRTSFVLTGTQEKASTPASSSAPTGSDSSGDGVPESWEVGDVILDLYEVRRVLGEGGMGKVHLVHHRGWQTDLAVKSVRPDRLKSRSHLEDFQREAEVWVDRLGLHPHVVSCHYVRVLGGLPRVFIDYVDGGSLRDWVRSGKLYEGGPEKSLERILDIAIQFAWGLDYAHEQGLIHQDVKPDNVMMTKDGVARVTDFGIARAREAAGEQADTAQAGQSLVIPGVGLCTREYASPEQLGKQRLTRRTDVWSWAVSVLELFIPGLIRKGFLGPAAPLSLEHYLREGGAAGGAPGMPEGVADLLRECFRKDADARPRGMLPVAATLQTIYQHVTGNLYPRVVPQPASALADTLNNRAVSTLELGNRPAAEALLERALQADPVHPEATYNLGILRWRSGTMTDLELLQSLRQGGTTRGAGATDAWLVAHVHLERGDSRSALKLLGQVPEVADVGERVNAVLAQAREHAPLSGGCLRSFGDRVRQATLARDERRVVTAGDDHTIRCWDVSTGTCLGTIEVLGARGVERTLSLSADSRYLLLGRFMGNCQVYDLEGGACVRDFGEDSPVGGDVCLSADGEYAFLGSDSSRIELWRVTTGESVRTIQTGDFPGSPSVLMRPSNDGRFLLTGSRRGSRIWDWRTGDCIRELGELRTEGFCLSRDDRLVLSRHGASLQLWDITTGRCIRELGPAAPGMESACFSADARLALSRGTGVLQLWDVLTGRCLRTFEGVADGKWCSLLGDGKQALLTSRAGLIELWDVCPPLSYRAPHVLTRTASPSIETTVATQEAFSRELRTARQLSAAGRPEAQMHHLAAARALPGYERHAEALEEWSSLYSRHRRRRLRGGWEHARCEGHGDSIRGLCASADGRHALSAGGLDFTLRLWDLASGQCRTTLRGHRKCVEAGALSADGRYALSGGYDLSVVLWDLSKAAPVRSMDKHPNSIESVSFTNDGRLAISGSCGTSEGYSDTLLMWDVATGECLRSVPGLETHVHWVCPTPDDRFVLFDQRDELRAVELATGDSRVSGKPSPGSRHGGISLSGDGRYAITSPGRYNSRAAVVIWDLLRAECKMTLQADARVIAACLSFDGRYALTGGSDHQVRIWDATSGDCLETFAGHADVVTTVCFTPDSRFALSGSADKTVRVWFLDWELEAPDPADWDEAARPYLTHFLARHTPCAGMLPDDRPPAEEEITPVLTRRGKPTWTEEDFQGLLYTLGCAGHGWLKPEGVRRELEKMAANWQGPPDLG